MLDNWVIKTKVHSNGTSESKAKAGPSKDEPDATLKKQETKKRNLDAEHVSPAIKKPRPSDSLPEEDLTVLFPVESQQMHPSWLRLLASEFSKPYYKNLMSFLDQERKAGKIIFPPEHQIFSWAKYPHEQVKVVILGQDPYHTPGKAHGLAFSVRPGERPPPSLLNMYQELGQDLEGVRVDKTRGCLERWAEQGVLLLNTLLTVEKGAPMSHQNKGWETFTDQVLVSLAKAHPKLVWILWGAHAQKKIRHLPTQTHLVLTSCHPSPLSASRGFFGSKPFSKANAYLAHNTMGTIDWASIFEP